MTKKDAKDMILWWIAKELRTAGELYQYYTTQARMVYDYGDLVCYERDLSLARDQEAITARLRDLKEIVEKEF